MICFSDAVTCARTHRQFDLDNPTILAYQALALAALGKASESEMCFERLKGIGVQDGEIVWNIARCYALKGDGEMSVRYSELLSEHALAQPRGSSSWIPTSR